MKTTGAEFNRFYSDHQMTVEEIRAMPEDAMRRDMRVQVSSHMGEEDDFVYFPMAASLHGFLVVSTPHFRMPKSMLKNDPEMVRSQVESAQEGFKLQAIGLFKTWPDGDL